MFVRNSVIALATVLASGTAALAAVDGDNNTVPGVQRQAAFNGAFASARMPVATPRATRTMVLKIEIDGDGNMTVRQR
jgi:hypothetical protein